MPDNNPASPPRQELPAVEEVQQDWREALTGNIFGFFEKEDVSRVTIANEQEVSITDPTLGYTVTFKDGSLLERRGTDNGGAFVRAKSLGTASFEQVVEEMALLLRGEREKRGLPLGTITLKVNPPEKAAVFKKVFEKFFPDGVTIANPPKPSGSTEDPKEFLSQIASMQRPGRVGG